MGCSSSDKSGSYTLNWDSGVLSRDGYSFEVTSYDGYEASYNCDEYTVSYNSCTGPADCPHKIADINEDAMSDFNGSKYFTAFFDTEMQMYTCVDKKNNLWNEGIFGVNGDTTLPVATMASIMEPALKELSLDGAITNIVINQSVNLAVTAGSFKATEQYVVIPGYLKVGVDDGSITFDQTLTIGNATVAYTVGSKYAYYGYKDLIIQVAQGIDINQYITFL